MTIVPKASAFTAAPLRNRICIELAAPVSEVWGLIGDLARFPEYSDGLERVDVALASDGRCTGYVCYFKPMEPGGVRLVSRDVIRWWHPGLGYASSGADGDSFGLVNDLHLVTIEPKNGMATVAWEEYFDAEDSDAMKAHFDTALADIAENLVRRFGGRIVDRYVQE
jgi:hypothetical protein